MVARTGSLLERSVDPFDCAALADLDGGGRGERGGIVPPLGRVVSGAARIEPDLVAPTRQSDDGVVAEEGLRLADDLENLPGRGSDLLT